MIDLFLRVEVIRKNVSDFSYNPCGIVLIDEPETHLHLSLQYQVLPTLTTLFPNIQFIVATHSPAVISSIKNITVFDLSSKETKSNEVVGQSFSQLMVGHLGLDNEFSNEADQIFKQVNDAVDLHKTNKQALKSALQEIFDENEQYLSATLRLELESMILVNA